MEKRRKADIKRRTKTAAAEIDACLEDQDLQGGWFKLNLWMKHRGDKAFRPSFEDMTKLTDEMEDMHKRVDPQEEPIPTLMAPYEIDDSVPTEDEITLAVKQLKSGKFPRSYQDDSSPSQEVVRQIHTLKEEDALGINWWSWYNILGNIQSCPKSSTTASRYMIPNPDGGSRGIGLLEVVLKVLECIIDSRVKAKVKFHDCLHGFRAARGTDTAQIESKLFQQLAGIDQVTLFKAYLDWPMPLLPSTRNGPSGSFMSMAYLPRCSL